MALKLYKQFIWNDQEESCWIGPMNVPSCCDASFLELTTIENGRQLEDSNDMGYDWLNMTHSKLVKKVSSPEDWTIVNYRYHALNLSELNLLAIVTLIEFQHILHHRYRVKFLKVPTCKADTPMFIGKSQKLFSIQLERSVNNLRSEYGAQNLSEITVEPLHFASKKSDLCLLLHLCFCNMTSAKWCRKICTINVITTMYHCYGTVSLPMLVDL